MAQSADEAKKVIAEMTGSNLDDWVRDKTFTNELEESVRGHIHEELTSWMFYRKLAADCARTNIALHGFSMLWQRCATECLKDMYWLEKYLISRGGRSKPTAIEAPKIEWPDNPIEPVHPVREALQVEKRLLQDLERLCALAEKCNNHSLTDAIQTQFLRKESKHVKDLGDLLQQVVRVSKQTGHGIYHLDKELRSHKGRIPWGLQNDPDCQEPVIAEITESLHHHKV
ncbi:hypothetical protein Plec18167_009660 [Paecilomyces lecythidis]|uniref:Ferritin n=1 Tax=Paecilomyces lecythidis TaxID=3004212 RepID=A0ABR3WMR8_9EURO